MLTLMDYLLVLPLFLMTAYYIGSPVLLYVSLKITAEPAFQPARLSDFPPEIIHHFIENTERLAADGFKSQREYLLGSDDPDTQIGMATLAHPETGDRITLIALLLRFGDEWRALTQWLEITTRFEDGSRLCSSNRLEPDWFAAPPMRRVCRFPSEQDPRQLYKRHRRAVACFAPEAPIVYVALERDPADLLLTDFREDCEHQSAAGILTLDSRGGVYHPTLRGAFRLTWRLLLPFRAVRLLQDRARASALACRTGTA